MFIFVSHILNLYSITSQTVPFWQSEPELTATYSYALGFTVASSADGIVCGVCERTSQDDITVQAILSGLTSSAEQADGWECANLVASQDTELTVSVQAADTTYACYFAVCSTYPLWPECAEDELTTVSARTAEDPNLGWASALLGLSFVHWLLTV